MQNNDCNVNIFLMHVKDKLQYINIQNVVDKYGNFENINLQNSNFHNTEN